MERKKALALAAAVTGVLGSTTVAIAAVGGMSLLGFGGGHQTPLGTGATSPQSALAAARVITRTKDVYDRVTVAGAAESTPITMRRCGIRRPAGSPDTRGRCSAECAAAPVRLS